MLLLLARQWLPLDLPDPAHEPAQACEAADEILSRPQYQWRAVVEQSARGAVFAMRMTVADRDWTGTVVAFELSPAGAGTQVRFSHRGWPEANAHYRTSTHCWALYLRILRRHLEHGETVPYDLRLEV